MIEIKLVVDALKWADTCWTWSSHNDYDGPIEERAITEQIYAEMMGWA